MGDGYNTFISRSGYEQVDIIGITDSDIEVYHSIDGFPAIHKDAIRSMKDEYDYIVVTVDSDQIHKSIVTEIVEMGICRDVIISSRVFSIPFFDFDNYIKIKKSNISILSDNCLASWIYHKFDLQFTSPTIKTWADNSSYINFISDIKGNMSLPMKKVEDVIDNPYMGIHSYYRGQIGNSQFVFMHDKTFESAVEKWKKRVTRFNYNNYIVVMIIRNDEMAYRFEELPIEKKVGFYWKQLDLKSVTYLPQWQSENVRFNNYGDFAFFVNRIAEDKGNRGGDWMKILLGEKNYNRVD